jgi:hypothetical protein
VNAEVWEQAELAYYSWKPLSESVGGFAMRRRGRIHVLPAEEPLRTQILAHELVHLLRTDAWAVLPPYVEEGLCDTAALEVEPTGAYVLRAQRLVHALQSWYGVNYWRSSTARGFTYSDRVFLPHVEIDPVDALLADPNTFSTYRTEEGIRDPIFRGLGYVIVSRIIERLGYDGLYALCERSVREGHRWLPAEWLLEAAELVNEPQAWRQATLELFGPAERACLVILSYSLSDDGAGVRFSVSGPLDDRRVRRTRTHLAIDDEEHELWIERIGRQGPVRTRPGGR